MNVPNKLTIIRVFMIPLFVILLLFEDILPYFNFFALAVFALASFTDFLDGHIARKYNLVTTFGKFMDPLADKILVCTALIMLIEFDRIPAVVVAIIMARDFIISGFRLIASDKGIVIAAGWLGKIKTVVQMVMCMLLLFTAGDTFDGIIFDIARVLGQIAMWLALILTVLSLIVYIWDNREVLRDKNE